MNGMQTDTSYRIALGVRHFCAVGGAEKISRRLAEHLVASGHDVDVFAYAVESCQGVRTHHVRKSFPAPRMMRDWVTGSNLARALKQCGADVTFGEQKMWGVDVLRPGGGVEADYWEAREQFLSRRSKSAGFCLKRRFDLKAESRGYHDPSLRRVIVNSCMVRDQLYKRYPFLEGNVVVIYNGAALPPVLEPAARDPIRCETLAEHHLPSAPLTLLFAGHEFKRKGLAHAINAVAMARAGGVDVQLLVAGRDQSARYQRQCDRLGIKEHVVFGGAVQDMRRWYATSDALILPTYYDPFANVTMEAMAAGLPVITTRQNGGHEWVDAQAGYVIGHPWDEDAMAGAIRELADRPHREALQQSARAVAARHPIKDKMKEIEEVLCAVAEEKRAAGIS